MNQLYIYIYPLSFGFPFHSGQHRALSSAPCATGGPYWFSVSHILVCICQPQSPSVSLPLRFPLVIKACFLSLTLHFVDKLFAPLFESLHTRDLIQHLSFSTWLTSFSTTISRPIPVAASGMISFFLWPSNFVMSCWAQSETSTVMERTKIYERPMFTLRIEVTKGGTEWFVYINLSTKSWKVLQGTRFFWGPEVLL